MLITADQLRFDHLGCTGHPVVRTPHLDGLAASGVTFAHAYAPATVCVPSRQSILSGLYPSAHGAMSNQSSLPESTLTLPEVMRRAGYRTAAVGKMHFHPVYAKYGFEHMRLAEQNGDGWKIDDYHARFLAERRLVDQWDLWDQQYEHRLQAPKRYWDSYGAATSELPEEAYHTTWIADESIRYLERLEGDDPFFLWSSFIKPHHPFDPPVPYDRLYDPADVVLPPGGEAWRDKALTNLFGDPRLGYFDVREMSEAALRKVAALYYGLITHIDHHVGRMLDVLAALGLRENTVVVFASDHGDYLGQYGLFLKYPNVPYDALARVPLIVAGPRDVVRDGRVVNELASLVDLWPTFASLAGAPTSEGLQGHDLTPALGGGPSGLAERTVFVEGNDGFKGIRSSRYKFLYHARGQTCELYDLREDPDELRDVAAERPGVVRRHLAHLADWLIDSARDRHRFEPHPKMVHFDGREGAVEPEGH